MKKIIYLVAVLALSFNIAVHASDGINPLDSMSFNLDDVVVTGTRTPKLLKDVPIQTRLITEEEIKLVDATNIQDMLQQEMPGVEFSYAMNQQVNMNFSGFAGQNVLILVDGERLAGETMDNVDFSRLNLSNVARIEIIKGAASALYGSSAAGGVINIITKDPEKPWAVNVNARLAAHNEQRYGGNVGFKTGIVRNAFDVQHTTYDTYKVCSDYSDECQFRNVYGIKTWNFSDKITVQPLENMKLTGHLGYFFKERLYNVDVPDRYRDFNGGLRGVWDISDNDHLEVSYSYDQYDKSDYQTIRKLDIRDYSNVQHIVRALYNHDFREKDILTIGGDFMRDYLMSYQFGGESHHQYTGDVFAQYDLNINKNWELIGAGRWDYFSDGNNSQATGKLGFRYNGGRLTVRGGYSGGFRAPSLKEKYMRFDMSGFFWIHGNEDLKAEKSHNFNLSGEYTVSHYNFTLAANYNIVNDKLSNSQPMTSADDPDYNYVQYINVSRMKVFGVEATAQAKWNSGLGAKVTYNFTHEDVVGSSFTQYCPARPHSLVARVTWDKEWTKWYGMTVSLSGRFLSAITYKTVEMTPPYNTYDMENPAYTIWKLQLSNRFKKGITLNLAVDNIFNYKPKVYYYNSPTTTGTSFMAGVSVDIDKLF